MAPPSSSPFGGQDLVHRDVKPSNVMLDAWFNPKLGDFGLASLFDHGGGSSETTMLAGTMGYLAPECVVAGKSSRESVIPFRRCRPLLLEIEQEGQTPSVSGASSTSSKARRSPPSGVPLSPARGDLLSRPSSSVSFDAGKTTTPTSSSSGTIPTPLPPAADQRSSCACTPPTPPSPIRTSVLTTTSAFRRSADSLAGRRRRSSRASTLLLPADSLAEPRRRISAGDRSSRAKL